MNVSLVVLLARTDGIVSLRQQEGLNPGPRVETLSRSASSLSRSSVTVVPHMRPAKAPWNSSSGLRAWLARAARQEVNCMAGRLLRRHSRAFSSAGSSPPVHGDETDVRCHAPWKDTDKNNMGGQLRPAVGTFLCCRESNIKHLLDAAFRLRLPEVPNLAERHMGKHRGVHHIQVEVHMQKAGRSSHISHDLDRDPLKRKGWRRAARRMGRRAGRGL